MKTRSLVVLLLLLAFSATVRSEVVTRVPPPKDEAELKKMMRLTWDQEVLPEGGSAQTLAALLAKGEVVLMNDQPPSGVPWVAAAGMMVDAPAEAVFGVVTDFDHYPGVVPMTGAAHAEPVPTMPNLYEVHFRVDLLFSWLTVEYSVYHYHRPPYRTDWAHASGEFEVNSGFWQMIPADQDRRAMTFYSVYSLPRQETVRNLYKEEPALELMTNVCTATMVVQAVKTESEKRSGQKLPPLVEKRGVRQILETDPQTLKLLAEKGKILVLEPGRTIYVTAGVVVDQPCETAYGVVSDFAAYPDYLPGVQKVEIRSKTDKTIKVYQEVVMKLWEFDFNSKRETEYHLDPPHSITWTIDTPSGEAPGYWQFLPLDDNSKCLMYNGSTEDIRSMGLVPRAALSIEPTLEYGVMASMSTAAMDGFKKRINSRP